MAITTFGIWLKTELMKAGLTQRDLSRRTGINVKVINDLIYGRNKKEEHIERIKEVLNASEKTA